MPRAPCLMLLMLLCMTQVDNTAAFTATKTPPAEPLDIPYIKCQVCEAMAKHMYRLYQSEKTTHGKRFKEEHLIDALEGITDQTSPSGEWVAKYDLVEKGDRLVMVEQPAVGECGRECKTIRKAAQLILGDHDTDVAERLFKGDTTRAQLQNWLCYELNKACVNKPPPLPKGREPGPPFKELDPQAAGVQSTLSALKAQGLGGEVYTRDEAIRKYMELSEDEDLDDVDLDDLPESKKEEVLRSIHEGGAGEVPVAAGGAATLGGLMERAQQALGGLQDGVRGLAQQAGGLVQGMFGGGSQADASQEL